MTIWAREDLAQRVTNVIDMRHSQSDLKVLEEHIALLEREF